MNLVVIKNIFKKIAVIFFVPLIVSVYLFYYPINSNLIQFGIWGFLLLFLILEFIFYQNIIININHFIIFLKEIFKIRQAIFTLTVEELKQRYLGSYLGILWAFIQPMVTILVLWFIFDIGFKSNPVQNVPFILWLMCGMVPWNFFSEALMTGTGSILGKPYLVQKVVFRVSILPVIQIMTALIIHIFFIIILIIFFLVYGFSPNIAWIQILYYALALIFFLIGISWITSAMVLFFRDLGQIINVIIQIGFWGTPVFWSMNMIPLRFHFMLKMNPVYYIVQGYRDSMIHQKWFWENGNLTIYFWGVTVFLFIIGGLIFKKLRPHFADVL
jgi:lipopolysaccharide transport system permease protein/teichoic acid transport system permease protein